MDKNNETNFERQGVDCKNSGHPQSAEQWTNDRLAVLRPDADWQPNVTRSFSQLREHLGANRGRGRILAWALTGVVAVGVPLMALPVTRAIAQRCVSACVEESSRVREFLLGNSASALPSSTYVKLENRKMAADFIMQDAAGKAVKLSDFQGKVVLLNFWATWCGPAR